MTDLQEKAMRLALDALGDYRFASGLERDAIDKLRQALAASKMPKEQSSDAQPEQEPVVFYRCTGCDHAYEQIAPSSCDCMEGTGFQRVNYYTAPPKWVGLTDADIKEGADLSRLYPDQFEPVARWAESKLKEKNHGAI